MAAVCGIVDLIPEKRDYPYALWLCNDNHPGDNPIINGLIHHISERNSYLALRFHRIRGDSTGDPDIMYVKPGQKQEDGMPTAARSWNLADYLGQNTFFRTRQIPSASFMSAVSLGPTKCISTLGRA